MPQIPLPVETIDDLIYSARIGDLSALKEDLGELSKQHSCPEGTIVASSIDNEPEAEGGSGACLLHFPAANGNFEILTYLLQSLQGLSGGEEERKKIINHRNYSGNTALHWAALNTHLDCVKALVEAGADISIKNDAGLDAVFLAERKAWSAEEEVGGGEEQKGEGEGQGEGEGKQGKGKMTPETEVVEWLLSAGEAQEEAAGKGEGEDGKEEENNGGEKMDTGK